MDLRDRLRAGLDYVSKSGLEVGPLNRPFVMKSEGAITYVDHVDTKELRRLHQDIPGFDLDAIVEVDAIWGEQNLQQCIGDDRKVDYVIASHVVEHVPDLITWLNELQSVLRKNGEIRLVVPDKRFTFDYTRRLTEMSDILDAYLRRARFPLPRCVLDHSLNVRDVNAAAAWAGPLDKSSLSHLHTFDHALTFAKDTLKNCAYHDSHCWVFTPASFARLMHDAVMHELINLSCSFFEDTIPGQLEFMVYLKIEDDKDFSMASWKHMERAATNEAPNAKSIELGALKTRISDLSAVVEKTQNDLRRDRAEIHALQIEKEKLAREVSQLRASTSWRITAPLRSIVRGLSRRS